MITFNDCPRKRKSQDILYGHVGKYIDSNVLILAGPNPLPNILNGIKIAKSPLSRVYLIERDKETFNKMESKIKNLNLPNNEIDCQLVNKKVMIRNTDIKDFEDDPYYPIRCEDLDFCQSIKECAGLFYYRLHRQVRRFSKGANKSLYKCIMITVCLRGCDRKTTLDTIDGIIDNVFSYNGGRSRLLNRIFTYRAYRDTNQMLSCAILYK